MSARLAPEIGSLQRGVADRLISLDEVRRARARAASDATAPDPRQTAEPGSRAPRAAAASSR